ncbi:MAG: hypothetical protein ABUL41_00030 [Chitinophagaceae bacterium]
MKKQLNNVCIEAIDPKTSLQLLVNQLVSNSLTGNSPSKCVVVNELPSEFYIASENMVAPIIKELLTTMVSNARNGRIYISAERSRDIITLQMQERNNYNGYALAFSLKSIEPQATEIGGCISIKGAQQLETTVSFSFPN